LRGKKNRLLLFPAPTFFGKEKMLFSFVDLKGKLIKTLQTFLISAEGVLKFL
jgi:hypothetical protein